jgi:gas vesicle protein
MGMFRKSKKKQAKSRLKELEKRFDFDIKDLEKRFGKLDRKELEKRLAKLDRKELEERLNIDTDALAKRARDLRTTTRQQENESTSAGFLAGLFVGAIVGIVLAIVFGKRQSGEVMDQFAHRAESLRDTATEKYHQVRGDAADQADAVPSQFGDDAAIEREVNGDVVETARDTVDSASEDVRDVVEDVKDATDTR